VHFAPDAVVWGEMPDTFAKSQAQHNRWESGRLQMARHYVPRLLRAALADARAGRWGQAWRLVDSSLEHLIPPFAVLAGLSGAALLVSLLIALLPALHLAGPSDPTARALAWGNVALAAGLIVGQGIYLLAALRLVGAPGSVYRQLIYAPVYVLWKLKQYAATWLGRAGHEWTRTTRNEA
jgi:hypothetical protein